MLQIRKYMGEYRYRDVVFEDGIPAIITKENVSYLLSKYYGAGTP